MNYCCRILCDQLNVVVAEMHTVGEHTAAQQICVIEYLNWRATTMTLGHELHLANCFGRMHMNSCFIFCSEVGKCAKLFFTQQICAVWRNPTRCADRISWRFEPFGRPCKSIVKFERLWAV